LRDKGLEKRGHIVQLARFPNRTNKYRAKSLNGGRLRQKLFDLNFRGGLNAQPQAA
jgi:hypothetical protein